VLEQWSNGAKECWSSGLKLCFSQFFQYSNIDGLVKSPKMASPVIPAKAGIQENKHFWTPAFAGVTALMTFYETIKYDALAKSRSPAFRSWFDTPSTGSGR